MSETTQPEPSDRVKLYAYIKSIQSTPAPELSTVEGRAALVGIARYMESFINLSTLQIDEELP